MKIKDAYKILNVSAIKVRISKFFGVGFVDVFLNHYKVISNVKCSVKFVIRFSSFDDCLGVEDMVLPRDWGILNRSRPLPVRFVLSERPTTLCHQTQHPFGTDSGNDFHRASAGASQGCRSVRVCLYEV